MKVRQSTLSSATLPADPDANREVPPASDPILGLYGGRFFRRDEAILAYALCDVNFLQYSILWAIVEYMYSVAVVSFGSRFVAYGTAAGLCNATVRSGADLALDSVALQLYNRERGQQHSEGPLMKAQGDSL
ncbi:hypothetical protein ON010_g8364 [Phytophthora cinnamomi]|nr:hypothetical protein ON010_g8364 [Phytophthora cinnamomi]